MEDPQKTKGQAEGFPYLPLQMHGNEWYLFQPLLLREKEDCGLTNGEVTKNENLNL